MGVLWVFGVLGVCMGTLMGFRIKCCVMRVLECDCALFLRDVLWIRFLLFVCFRVG